MVLARSGEPLEPNEIAMGNFGRSALKSVLPCVLSGMLMLFGGDGICAQLIEHFRNGPVSTTINWQRGYIETTARGTARFTGNIAQEELMALEAARVLAKAGLVEMLNGIKVTGTTTVAQFMTRNSTVTARFSGLLRGAVPVAESVKWVEDKAAKRGKVAVGRATYRVCLIHEDETCRKKAMAVIDLVRPPSKTVASTSQRGTTHRELVVTGLIVDLGNKLFLPVLSPEIVTTEGKIVFSMTMVTKRHATGNSTVRYSTAVEYARKMQLVGANPMTVQAVDITDDNRIVVSARSAQRIASAVKEGATFLAEGRIVIALD